METINLEPKNILILALTGSVLSGTWLAYRLKLFKLFPKINDEKKILLPSFLFLFSPFLLPFIFSHYMLPESTGIYIILSAVISGIMLLTSNFINNKFQLEREQKQGIRQQESEQQKWYREKIYNCYKTSIQVLTEIMKVRFEAKNNHITSEDEKVKLYKLGLDLTGELGIIMESYPDKDFKELAKQINTLTEYLNTEPVRSRMILTTIMNNDSRIKSINNG